MSQPPQFFVDHKRGEVNEIKAILRNPKAIKDPAKKREVIKKVIAYMTLGIDVSRIFGEMIMAANTKDLVQKKKWCIIIYARMLHKNQIWRF